MSMVKGVEKLSSLDPTKKAFSLFEEFKNFAFKGNVIDLAVGVIIGAAFGKIIDSLVKTHHHAVHRPDHAGGAGLPGLEVGDQRRSKSPMASLSARSSTS